MITQIIHIKVKDFDKWEQIHESKHDLQIKHKLINSHVAVEKGNENHITLILDWEDEDLMKAYFQLPEIQQAMKDTNPVAPPKIRLLKE